MRPGFGAAMRADFAERAQCLEHIDMKTSPAITLHLLTTTQFPLVELGSFETMVHSLEDDRCHLFGAKIAQHIQRLWSLYSQSKQQPEKIQRKLGLE